VILELHCLGDLAPRVGRLQQHPGGSNRPTRMVVGCAFFLKEDDFFFFLNGHMKRRTSFKTDLQLLAVSLFEEEN